jgi:O-acetyl-ADP-ribose deacetylase (regulator of RNase III)
MTHHPDHPSDWTDPSVMKFAPDGDAIGAINTVVAELLLAAADAGALGMPTDPFQLAELMGIGLRPQFDVADARLVPDMGAHSGPALAAPLRQFVASGADLVIEYNPTRPRGRLRYSVAHELVHALFPDAGQDVRNRTHTGAVKERTSDDSWQLELLCNIGAAELLMPSDAMRGLLDTDPDIDFLMSQRARFNVSTEALLRRLVHATDRPIAVAAFNRVSDSIDSGLRCEYVLGSRAWAGGIQRGDRFEAGSALSIPTAVGQTARGKAGTDGEIAVQAVGIPPYPNRVFPRILALLEMSEEPPAGRTGLVEFRTADIAEALDAAEGATSNPVYIAHVVNDSARQWGGHGVAALLARLVPDAAHAYREWASASGELALGGIHKAQVRVGSSAVTIVSLVAQQGYGPSMKPRLSYVALAEALDSLAAEASRVSAVVHMPRIGAGQAGGRWDLVEATVERTLVASGVPVVIYTRPASPDYDRRAWTPTR